MHPSVFAEFDRICRARGAGGDVLEIGAVASDDTLLCLPALRAARSKVGVNLTGPLEHAGFAILAADANDLRGFADASFDTVLTNSVLEHDRSFWRTLTEIERVARPGALIVIGVPGFAKLAGERFASRAARLPVLGPLLRRHAPALLASTLTLQVHDFPADYYRFSARAAHDVFLERLDDGEVRTLLVPPRIIAIGVKRREPATPQSPPE
jgi:SAM-dependent methyltransferase